jgi:sugar kinases, ribokinase family
MMKVLSFGEILLRLASPGYTKLFQKDSLEATFCGGEANVAVSLANFGVQSEFLTVVPDNDIGHASLNALCYFGVDTSKAFFKNGRMGLYYLEKGASQRPSRVIYDRVFSSIALAEPTDFDWDKLFDGVSWFHWTGINPALSDNMVQICERACKKAKEKGITISCDLNFRKNLWSSEKAQKVMSNLVQYVDVCIANEEDADKVLGIKAPNNNVESGKLNKSGYEYVAKEICKRFGCKKVAITLRESINASHNGWSGMIYDATGVARYSAHYNMDIVDRVGGGDSFTGAMIYSLITGKNDKDAIEFAVAASCLKHSIEGDFNRVTVSDVENLIKNGGNGRVQR